MFSFIEPHGYDEVFYSAINLMSCITIGNNNKLLELD